MDGRVLGHLVGDILLLLAVRLLGTLHLRVHNLWFMGNVGGLRLTTRPLRHNTAMLRCESFDGEVEVTAPGCAPLLYEQALGQQGA